MARVECVLARTTQLWRVREITHPTAIDRRVAPNAPMSTAERGCARGDRSIGIGDARSVEQRELPALDIVRVVAALVRGVLKP